MFRPSPDHNMTELLQKGHDKLEHNAKIPGHLLQEAFPDFKGWVGSPLDVPHHSTDYPGS